MNRRRRLITALSLSIPVPFLVAQVAEADLTVAQPQPQPQIAVEDPPPAPDVSVQPAASAPDLQPAAPAEQVQPAAPAQDFQPAAPAEQVQPAAPAQDVQPAAPAPDPQPEPPADTVQVAPPAPQPQVEVVPPSPQPDVTPPPSDPAPPAQDLQVAPPAQQPDVTVADSEPQPDLHVESTPDPNAQPVDAAALQGGDGAAVQSTAPAAAVQPAAGDATVQDAATDATAQVQPTADPSRVDPQTPVAVADAPATPAHVEVAPAHTAETLVKRGAETAVEGPGDLKTIRERAASQNGRAMKTSPDAETRTNAARSQAHRRWDKSKVEGSARFFTLAGGGLTVTEDRLDGHSLPDSAAHAGVVAGGQEAGEAAGIASCAWFGLATEGVGAAPCALVVVITGTTGGIAADKAYTKVRDNPDLRRRLTAPLAAPTTTSDPMSTSRFLRGLFAR